VHRAGTIHEWFYPDFSLAFEDWVSSGDFSFQSSASGLDDATRARSLANTLAERATPLPRFDVPMMVSAFRGDAGHTDLVVAYGVPVERPAQESTARAGLGLRSGAFVRAADALVLAERQKETDLVPRASLLSLADGAWWPDVFAFPVAPGTAEVIVEVEQSATASVGVGREAVDVPDLSGGELQLSSLVLALDAGETEPDEAAPATAIRRGDIWFRPAPSAVHDPGVPIRIYAEVYGLALVEQQTTYAVEARLEPVDEAGGLRRWIRRARGATNLPGVAVAFEASGPNSDEPLLLWLDATAQSDGAYRLTLSVRDLVTGESVNTTRDLRLERPRLLRP
jgi:hypothetical protein